MVKKITKTKKKRIRYPKNFDIKNPPALPDAERWLPKWQRKNFRKKKGALGANKTQGSAVVDNSTTKNTF